MQQRHGCVCHHYTINQLRWLLEQQGLGKVIYGSGGVGGPVEKGRTTGSLVLAGKSESARGMEKQTNCFPEKHVHLVPSDDHNSNSPPSIQT
eukprot:114597-Pelagomonas_calceolata.AAC.2